MKIPCTIVIIRRLFGPEGIWSAGGFHLSPKLRPVAHLVTQDRGKPSETTRSLYTSVAAFVCATCSQVQKHVHSYFEHCVSG